MTNTDKSMIEQVAENLGMGAEQVAPVVDEFLLQLHRRLYEYKGLNGDFIGEELHWQIGKQGFYHLLGFLDCFSDRYQWEAGIASEYLMRLGSRSDWLPFRHQIESWKERAQ